MMRKVAADAVCHDCKSREFSRSMFGLKPSGFSRRFAQNLKISLELPDVSGKPLMACDRSESVKKTDIFYAGRVKRSA